ncbi:MAG: hypothetical protein ACMV1K_01400 [Sulfurospirillum sp.]
MRYLMLMVALLFIGCGGVQPDIPVTPNTVKVKQKCHEDSNVTRPDFIAEEGDNVQFIQAVLVNNERRKSYIYDLEAEIEKCR